jgi:subtilisin family serine protease
LTTYPIDVRAPDAWAKKLTGAGVTVAVLDTGVNPFHADLERKVYPVFVNPNTTGYLDALGHGTHVTGIAASNGLATGNGLPAQRYVGVAPAAGIIAIQGTHGDATFTDSDVIAGCRFAVDEGSRLGRPVVANLSLGSNSGPHDGTSDLEVALDDLFPADQPGRAIVIASGNEGGRDQHAGGWALAGAATVPVELSTSAQPDAQLAFELWHTGTFALTVISPAGHH